MSQMVVGKTIVMPCMRQGLVKYDDETILVQNAALCRMAKSAHGIPVTIDHPGHAITEETIGDSKVVGRVSKLFFNSEDSLWYAEFIVDRQDAVDLLKEGWGVSTAWYGKDYIGGGSLNAVPYDREVVDASYEHLAIVRNPRYEMAKEAIFLNSSQAKTCGISENKHNLSIDKNSKGTPMFGKIWRTKREEVRANENEELYLELEGKEMPLSAVIEALKEKAPEEKKEASKKYLGDDDEVEVNGVSMKVGELKKHYADSMAKAKEKEPEAKNEDEEKEKEKEPEAKNEDEDEEKDKKPAEKKNSVDDKNFDALKKAYENGSAIEVESQFQSTRERVQQGKIRYGSNF